MSKNKDGVVSIGIEYKQQLNEFIAEYESALIEASNSKALSKGMKKQFESVTAELRSFKSEINKQLQDLSIGKVDTSKFDSFKQLTSRKFKDINAKIDALNLAVASLNSQMEIVSKGIDLSKIKDEFKEFENYVNQTNSAVDAFLKKMGDTNGVSLFTYDATNEKQIKSIIKSIEKELNNLQSDTAKDFELFNEKEAQNKLDSLSYQLRDTVEQIDKANERLSNPDISSEVYRKTSAELSALELKATNLTQTITDLFDIAENKKFNINILDDTNSNIYDEYFDNIDDRLKNAISSVEVAKKELKSLLGLFKPSNSTVEVSDKLDTNTARLGIGATISVSTDELWKELNSVLTDLQDKLRANPVVAPVKLVVAGQSVSKDSTLNTSKSFSKKYQKVLAQTSEDAIIDMEGVYKKTYTSIMDEAVNCAKQSIARIQDIFTNNPISVGLQLTQDEIDKINNFVLSNNDGKKIDISGQIDKTKKDVEELNLKLKETTEIIKSVSSENTVETAGVDKSVKRIQSGLSDLEKIQDIITNLKNIEITIAKVGNVSSVSEIEEQWEKVVALISKSVKLNGEFYKNVNENKIYSECAKYLSMGGTNDLSSINKLNQSEETMKKIVSKAKELNAQKINTESIDDANNSLIEVTSGLDNVIERLDHLINLTKDIGNTFYAILKDMSISDVDKQWKNIETKFKSIADESGKINLSKQKKDIQELIEMYQKYENIGGTQSLSDLTDNVETVKKLDKVYKQLNESKEKSDSNEKVISDLNKVDEAVNSLSSDLEKKIPQSAGIAAASIEDSAERQILALSSVVDHINMIVDGLKKIKGIKIPDINVGEVGGVSNVNTELKEEIKDTSNINVKETQKQASKIINIVENVSKEAINTTESTSDNIVSTTSKIKKEIQDLGNGTTRIINEIGMTYEDFLNLVNTEKENNALEQTAKSAEKASKGKNKFAKANKEVKDSANTSANVIEQENKAFDENKWNENIKIVQNYADSVDKLNKLKVLDKGTGKYAERIESQEQKIEDLKKKAREATKTMSEMFNPHDVDINVWNDWLQAMDKVSSYFKGSDESIAELNDVFNNVLNSNKNNYLNKLDKYANSNKYTDDFITRVNDLKSKIQNISSVENLQGIDAKFKQLVIDSKDLNNILVKSDAELSSLIADMLKFQSANTNMSSTAKATLSNIIVQAKEANKSGQVSVATLNDIKAQFSTLKGDVYQSGKMGKSFFDQIGNRLTDMNSKLIAQYFSLQDIIRYLRQAADIVIELNTNIVELAKVSDATTEQIYKDFSSYAEIAERIGGTISDTISATADWARSGYSVEASKELAEVAQLYKNVGDGIDIDDANESLISTLQGFQLEAEQAEHIIDVFNEVSNNEAISSSGIGEALQRSAASFYAANTSLEKSVALISATNSVLQDEEKVGNMWKTVSARIRGAKTELEDMGEDTDDMVTSTSKLRDEVKAMTGFDIMQDEDTFKDIYDIIIGIGEAWDGLTDVQQAGLLEDLAGKNQSNALAATLNNIDLVKKAYGEATNAEGSAREEQEEYTKSIQYSIDQTKAKLEELANDFLSSDFLKGLINVGGELIDILDTIIKNFGTLNTIAAASGAILSSKKFGGGLISQTFDSNGNSKLNLKNLFNKDTPNSLFGKVTFNLSDVLSESELASVNAFNNAIAQGSSYSDELQKSLKNASSTVLEYAENAQIGAEEGKSCAISMEQISSSSKLGVIGTKALGTALNSLATVGVTMAISAIISAIVKLSQATDEIRDKAEEVSNQFNEDSESITNYKKQVEELQNTISNQSSTIEEVTNARKELRSIQNELIANYGTETDAIETITDAVNGETDAWDKLVSTRWQESELDFNYEKWNQVIANRLNAYGSNTDRMLDEYGAYDVTLSYRDANIKDVNEYAKILSQFGDTSSGELKLSGTATEVYDTIVRIQKAIDESDYEFGSKVTNALSHMATEAKEASDKYKDYYDQYVLNNKIFDSEEYTNYYKNLTQAYEDYNNAVNSGDEEATKKAEENLKNAMATALTSDDESVVNFFKNMYSDLTEEVNTWNFEVKFNANTDNVKTNVEDALNKVGSTTSKEDLEHWYYGSHTEEENEGYNELVRLANENFDGVFTDLLDYLESVGEIVSESKQKLIDKFGEDKVNTLSDEDLEIAYTIPQSTINSWDDLISKIKIAKLEIESVDTSNLSYTEALNSIQSLSDGLDQLATIYTDVQDGSEFTWSNILNNEDFANAFGNMENVTDEYANAYEDFVETVTNNSDDITACQDAFDNLATAYIYNSDALSNITEENKDATIAMLEQMGIANATEVVEGQLARTEEIAAYNKILLANASTDLANVTLDELSALQTEGIISEETAQKMAAYALEKQLINLNTINTEADCQNLITLAQYAGASTEALVKLNNLKSQLYNADGTAKIISNEQRTNVQNAIKDVLNDVYSAKVDVEVPQVKFDGELNSSSASDAGEDAGDAYVEAFEDAYDKLNDLKDAGVINEKEYLDRLRVLYEKYFKDIAGYEDEYLKYRQEYLDGYKSLYEDVIGYCVDLIQDRIDVIEDQKDAAVDSLEAQQDALEKQKDAYQDIIDGIEDQIDALDDQKDAIQDQIDAIQDANDERERSIQLQKDEYELQRAMNQRVNKVYRKDKGYVYEVDQQSIRDAKEQVDSDKTEIQIADLEKQIDALEKQADLLQDQIDYYEDLQDAIDKQIDALDEQIEATEQYYDNLVKGLEKSKDAYQDLLDMYDKAELSSKLSQLGLTEADILNSASGAFDTIKTGYMSVLADLNRNNEALLASLSAMSGIDLNNLSMLGDTASYLTAIGNSAEGVDGVTSSLDSLGNAATNATNAIGGSRGGTGTSKKSGKGSSKGSGSGNSSSSSSSGGMSGSLSSAIDEATSKKESIEELASEFNPTLTDAINSATAAIGGGETTIGGDTKGNIKDTKAQGGGTHAQGDSSTLVGALQNEEQIAFDEKKGITAQGRAWDSTANSIEGVNKKLNDTYKDLEKLTNHNWTVTVNIVTNGNTSGLAKAGGNLPSPSTIRAGFSYANGNISGLDISGSAYAGGKIGADKDHKALVGEIGREMIIRGDRWFLAGQNGAEFTDIKKGDIIFSAAQTEELFKNGKINTRGYAYADGTIGNKFPESFKPFTPDNQLANISDKFVQSLQSATSGLEILKNTVDNVNGGIKNIQNNNTNTTYSVNHQEINVSLPNVKDNTSATALLNELKGISQRSVQYFNKR